MFYRTRTICIILALIARLAEAQDNGYGVAGTLSPAEGSEVIDSLVAKVNARYIFPKVASRMTMAIRQHQRRHAYDTVTSGIMLAELLTQHLRDISHDGHLGVDYSAKPLTNDLVVAAPSADEVEAFRASGARDNFNFRKLEILNGNIGYLKFDAFYPAAWIKETVSGAMAFLANTEAIILDLRDNHGFAPDGVQLMESYFFAEETHMTDQFDRDAQSMRQVWTFSAPPGPTLADKALYILTSHSTFSAAEDFSYNLQALGRAKIIGETTGGGAHGTRPYRIGKHFTASIPVSYCVNPVTGTDWEGTGVIPDLKTEQKSALRAAHLEALRDLMAKYKSDPRRLESLIRILESIE